MLISEMISRLEIIKKSTGDLPVYMQMGTEDGNEYEINTIDSKLNIPIQNEDGTFSERSFIALIY